MEFKDRKVQKKFRARQVKPRAPRPRSTAGGMGPDLGDMKTKIETEYQKAGEHPPEFFENKPIRPVFGLLMTIP